MFPHTDNSFTNGTIYTNPPKINKKVHKDISIDVKATKTQMTILTWKDKIQCMSCILSQENYIEMDLWTTTTLSR